MLKLSTIPRRVMTVALSVLTSLLDRALWPLWHCLGDTTLEGSFDHLGWFYGTDEAQKAETVLSAVNVYMCNLIPDKP